MSINLVFRVGVTGKRELTDNQSKWVAEQIAWVLSEIKSAVTKAREKAGELYCGESAELRAVSPLAKGADRIFARKAHELGYHLDCPLPFAKAEYAKDFPETIGEFDALFDLAKDGRRPELDGSREALSYPYDAIGRFVLDHSDILIAVWDGLPAAGKGGTAHVMEIASRQRIPVFCLRIDSEERHLLSTRNLEDKVDLTAPRIAEAVDEIVLPIWIRQPKKHPPDNPDVTGSYVPEAPIAGSFLGWLWTKFEKVVTLFAKIPTAIKVPKIDAPEYVRMNTASITMVGQYRGAFLVNFALGTFAVFSALLEYAHHCYGIYWLSGEFAAIVIVIALVAAVHFRRWHFRSIDCRYLAEQLRIFEYIKALGLSPPQPRLPAHYIQSDLENSWMEWRLRAIARATPMPKTLSLSELRKCVERIRQDWVNGQLSYHARNRARNHIMEHRLHGLAWFFVVTTLAACICHFWYHGPSAKWLTVIAAGFPAAAGAAHAISTQGEFRRLAERSEAMARTLSQTGDRLDEIVNKRQLTAARLRTEARQLSQLMLEEVVDWQALYRKDFSPH